jgi:hypothetical protein
VTAEDEHTTIQVLDHLQTLWKKGERAAGCLLGKVRQDRGGPQVM